MGKHSFDAILWEVYNRYNRCHSSSIMVNLVLPCDFCDPAPELRIIHTSYEYCIHTVTYGDDANAPLPFNFFGQNRIPQPYSGSSITPKFWPTTRCFTWGSTRNHHPSSRFETWPNAMWRVVNGCQSKMGRYSRWPRGILWKTRVRIWPSVPWASVIPQCDFQLGLRPWPSPCNHCNKHPQWPTTFHHGDSPSRNNSS